MKKLSLIVFGLLLLAGSLSPLAASADVNDFTVTNFSSDQTLSNSDPQGELRIKEHIEVDYTDFNHGILRAIPDSYKGHPLKLKVLSVTSDTGAPSSYSTYGSNGNTVLKIGDPSRTVTGHQEYNIDYTVQNVITFYQDHDELYWDVNGDQWDQPFTKVTVTLHLPAGLKQTKDPICYAGSYGSTGQTCTIVSEGNVIKAETTQTLYARQTLTYVAAFDKGYFKAATWVDDAKDYGPFVAKFMVPFLLIGGYGFVQWLRKGRDPKGRGTIIPEYQPPKGLKPMAVGTIVDFSLDNKDITATIVDLAVRGYIKIIETKKEKRLAPDTTEYSLQLVKNDPQSWDANEASLINSLFTDLSVGATANITESKSKLYTTSQKLRKTVLSDLTAAGYFRNNPMSSGRSIGIIAILGFMAVFFGGAVLGLPLAAGIIAGVIVAVIFKALMAARTAQGVEAKEQILGLKMYMEVAEKDRIEKLQGPNAAYAENAKEPVKTVELFEKLLPYAIALSVEKQWAGKFESLYTTPPDWYSGNWATFNSVYLINSLNSGLGASVNTAFSPPSSSSSSGFGGGGFSGGGGGGGGGGGW